MSNLLKEAIADAKAVRETALQNAKAALEEAFTPRLQSMLSQKLKEDEYEEDEVAVEEDDDDDDDDEEKPLDVDPEDEGPESGDEGEAEVPSDEGGEEAYDDGEEVGDGEEPVGDDVAVEPESEEEDLDVEAIVRELEAEEDEEAPEEGDYSESETEEDEEVAETIEVNGQKYSIVKEEEAEEDEVAEESVTTEEEAEEDEGEAVEEIVDLSELLDELEEEETEEDEDVAEEVAKLQGDLTEHRKVIKYLKSKLNEVNLLNAKLLFTNKLFKTYNLNNNQKLRVVETFDRAKNSREIKLIYSTLAESFSGKTSGVKVSKINESFASKPVKSTKPSKKVIAEGSDLASRFKKLAGIK